MSLQSKDGQVAPARERMQQLNQQSRAELENSLLKENLLEYTELFEKLKKEQSNFLAQAEKRLESERELNRQSVNAWLQNSNTQLNQLQENVKSLQDSNGALSTTMRDEVSRLCDGVVAAATSEVEKAMQGNIRALETASASYQASLKASGKKYSEESRVLEKRLEKIIGDFESKKQKFFQFDSAKTVFFWLSQLLSIGTFGLFLWFVFGK